MPPNLLQPSLRPFVLTILALLLLTTTPHARRATTLNNGRISAVFDDRGVTALTDVSVGRTVKFRRDGFAITVDGQVLDSAGMGRPKQQASRDRVVYTWSGARGYEIAVTYELQPEWRFVSKQISIVKAPAASYRINAIDVFKAELVDTPGDTYVPGSVRPNLGTGTYGVFLRFPDARGLLATVQNPFLRTEVAAARFEVAYAPDMDWRSEYGPFLADRGLLSIYRLSGRTLPATMMWVASSSRGHRMVLPFCTSNWNVTSAVDSRPEPAISASPCNAWKSPK